MDSPYVYISGSLTVLEEHERERLRAHYDWIGGIVESLGYGAYIPHHYGDPVRNAERTPQEIDEIDRSAVMNCAVMIVDVSIPALGVGIELEMAYHSDKSVILLVEERKPVSRLALGNPAVYAVIQYDREDLETFGSAIRGAFDDLRTAISGGPFPDVLQAVIHPGAA